MTAPSASPLKQVRALLIEDDADDQTLFARTFARCGEAGSLEVADSADSARRQLIDDGAVPDVVFIDLHLPGTPAQRFVEWLRSSPSTARVLTIAVTSNCGCASLPPQAFGVDALLVKPVSTLDVAALLALARVRGQSRSAQ